MAQFVGASSHTLSNVSGLLPDQSTLYMLWGPSQVRTHMGGDQPMFLSLSLLQSLKSIKNIFFDDDEKKKAKRPRTHTSYNAAL